MTRFIASTLVALTVTGAFLATPKESQAQVSISVGVGRPGPAYRPAYQPYVAPRYNNHHHYNHSNWFGAYYRPYIVNPYPTPVVVAYPVQPQVIVTPPVYQPVAPCTYGH